MREDDIGVSADGRSDEHSIGMQRMSSLLSLGLVLISVPDGDNPNCQSMCPAPFMLITRCQYTCGQPFRNLI